MFGFAQLASFDYFGHVSTAIGERYRARGREATVRVCEVHPTASIRRRAAKLATMIADTAGDDGGPIHVVGHSTGGLDARLVASPSVHLAGVDRARLGWTSRLRSVTTINAPHYGTPLAAFFATVSGQRLLYATSALTVAALKLGAPPLAAASALVAAFGRFQLRGYEESLIDRMIESVIRVLDDASSAELRDWLRQLAGDQGGIVQLMPEAMDLFQAGVEDRPGVRYQSVATYAPRHGLRGWASALRSPWGALSAMIFTALSNITAGENSRYPCAPPDGSGPARVRAFVAEDVPLDANDGVVPLYSQVWGELVWVGRADHLDVVGHFPGRGGHNDWLASGARFDQARFDLVMDRIVAGLFRAEDEAERHAEERPAVAGAP
jgi:hypothetical protein